MSADFPLPVSAPLPAPPHPVFGQIVLTRFLLRAARSILAPERLWLGHSTSKAAPGTARKYFEVSLEASQSDLLQAGRKLTLSPVKDPAPFRSLPGLYGITCGC